ncbi:hypothetical protein ACFYO0_09915 [Streptomyces sp. NPDC006365]|uniref:hypothetical protein n=1 Tax=Streptomyces sp. NPDC006365 TaxID=3364744 RepID=UPI00367A54C0
MSGGALEGEDLVVWREFSRWSKGIHAAVNKAVTEAADLSSVPSRRARTRVQWRARIVRLTEEAHRHLTGAFEAHGRAFRTMPLDRSPEEQRAALPPS